MICAECGETTETRPCSRCGAEPLLAGIYQLLRALGRGASGTTFEAVDIQTSERVAVKEMPIGRASTVKARELLAREARVLQELEHPAIPRFITSMVTGEGRGRAVILVLELIEGEDLRTEMAHRRYTATDVLHIAAELLDVFVYLHTLSPPVIHRDLKPGNVMRRAGEHSLVLLDFGAVRDTLRDLDLGGSTVAGTFGYMAPEQLMGDASPMSDLYGLGALMVHLLSRTEPQQMLKSRGGLDWEKRVSVPDGLRALLLDLLEPDPDLRRNKLGSTTAVKDRVKQLLVDPQGPRALPQRTALPQRIHPQAPSYGSLAGVGATLGLALLLFAVSLQRQPSPLANVPIEVPRTPPILVERIAPTQPSPPREPRPEPPAFVDVSVGDLPPLGSPQAPVTIVAFSDYQCPFCDRAIKQLQDLVREREGEVALYMRDFPLAFHKSAREAAAAVRCAAAQDRMWTLHDALFESRSTLDSGRITGLAADSGLDMVRYARCMSDPATEAAIARDIAEGTAAGVTGTPTFFVNGERLVGAQPLERFIEAIKQASDRVQPRGLAREPASIDRSRERASPSVRETANP